MDSLPVLEARNLAGLYSVQAVGENLFLASSSFWWLPWHSWVCGHITPASTSVLTRPSPHVPLCHLPLPLPMRAFVLTHGVYLDDPG